MSSSTASISASAYCTFFFRANEARARNRAPLHRPRLGRQRSLAPRRRRNALLRFSAPLCLGLQRLLSAPHDRALAARPARHQHRTAQPHRRWRLDRAPRWRLRPLQRLLAIFYGAALANVLRGVPLQADGYFFLPLWTNWQPGPIPASSTGTRSSAASSLSSPSPFMALSGSPSKSPATSHNAPAAHQSAPADPYPAHRRQP